jgi:hypothetical protein
VHHYSVVGQPPAHQPVLTNSSQAWESALSWPIPGRRYGVPDAYFAVGAVERAFCSGSVCLRLVADGQARYEVRLSSISWKWSK